MKKKDYELIQKINEEIYEKYKDKLHFDEYVAPELRKLAQNIVEGNHDDVVTPEEKEATVAAWELGLYNSTHQVVNKDIADKIGKEVQHRLVKEIKAGNLTNPKDDPAFKKLMKNNESKKSNKGKGTND